MKVRIFEFSEVEVLIFFSVSFWGDNYPKLLEIKQR